jgi:malate dehydrogenase (oxaloacetate-decarboxylating)(NADP+)
MNKKTNISNKKLQDEFLNLKKNLLNLNFQKFSGQLEKTSQIKKTKKRIVFADGEDENTLKAAIAFKNSGLGIPILVAKKETIKQKLKEIGYSENFAIDITNSTYIDIRLKYVSFLFKKMQREQGLLERDCDRMVRNDRVIWASCMVSCGDADGAVTGNTRRYGASLDKISKVVDTRPGEIMFGLNMIVNRGKTVFHRVLCQPLY